MQASIDAFSLKPFTKALVCLSKYGDDLTLHATPESLSLSATNSSLSAYCRFKYTQQFFSKYRVGDGDTSKFTQGSLDEVPSVTGQLLVKSLLSILKHRTVEKTVERCELSIVEGDLSQDQTVDEDHDSLESKLIVRLHCKHGIVKTHRLLLNGTTLMSPGVPDDTHESRLTVGAKSVKDVLEHFPVPIGPKSDPQLIWRFDDGEVTVKSFEAAGGKGQMSTELTLSSEEFDLYDMDSTPITIAFHLKEFNATIALADSLSLPLELRFTDPAAPLFIDVESDSCDILFVISTSQVPGTQQPEQVSQNRSSRQPSGPSQSSTSGRKRDREEEEGREHTNHPAGMPPPPLPRERVKKPMKAVQRVDANNSFSRETSRSRSVASTSALRMGSMAGSLPPSLPPPLPQEPFQSQEPLFLPSQQPQPSVDAIAAKRENTEPLFLPGSQLSRAEEEVLVATGLGLESMSAHELEAMLDDDAGEEVPPSQAPSGKNQPVDDNNKDDRWTSKIAGDNTTANIVSDNGSGMSHVANGNAGSSRSDSLSFFDDMDNDEDIVLAPTQDSSFRSDSSKSFHPLFED